jgi:phage gp16-like protein
MKTTIDLDDKKLRRLMKLTGLKTRKETIDFALTEAERLAKIRSIFAKSFYVDPSKQTIASGYDVMEMRKLEKPSHAAD